MSDEKLVKLAMAANNVIMNGSFTGDDIVAAADLMAMCQHICNEYNNSLKRCSHDDKHACNRDEGSDCRGCETWAKIYIEGE